MATAPITNNVGVSGNGGGENNILSDKVARALQVRTDTPAMKAALEAFANVPSNNYGSSEKGKSSNTASDSFTIDAKSVRMAIERDALDRTLLLQEELRKLVSTVSELRQGISDTAAIAHQVRDAIYTPVIKKDSASLPPPPSAENTDDGGQQEGGGSIIETTKATTANSKLIPLTEEESLHLEESLAAQLSDAFLRRDQAQKRLEAVHTFLEKFNLSEQDSRLLDHYAFEDMDPNADVTTTGEDLAAGGVGGNPINGLAFLEALERTRQIRVTLEHTTLDDNRLGASSALRMMESLTQKQEQAYERLYHWIQNYLSLHATSAVPTSSADVNTVKNMIDSDQFDEMLAHPFVKRAVYTLRNVPAFYSHTLELIASSRRQMETKQFLLALTTGYSGFPPIEMKAHDSVAYVGDMLAFCFKAFSVEADVAKGLINYKPNEENDNEKNNNSADEEENKNNEENQEKDSETKMQDDDDAFSDKPYTALDMLSVSMSGLSRPLKSRIFQVVATLARRPDEEDDDDDDAVLQDDFDEEGAAARTRVTQLYDICGLLLFYASRVESVIKRVEGTAATTSQNHEQQDDTGNEVHAEYSSTKNPLVLALLDCLAECSAAYEATFRVYSAMLDQLAVLTGDSEATLAYAMMLKLADVRIASPGFSQDVSCPKQFKTILSIEFVAETLTDAALTCCNALDDAVTLKRSVMTANKAGMNILLASTLNEKINEQETILIDELVASETSEVLDVCGLNALVSAYNSWKQGEESGTSGVSMLMATYPGLTLDEAEYSMKEFYASLYSPPLPSLEDTIKDPVLRKSARKKIAQSVCETYRTLYSAIIDQEKAGYDDLKFLGHTPEQVEQLFTA